MKKIKNVQKLRELLRLSREQLAKKLDITYVTVYTWELGTRQPGMKNCRLLIDVAKKAGIDKIDDKPLSYEFFHEL
jgi:DNA-binding transcriptional regulator YiaG